MKRTKSWVPLLAMVMVVSGCVKKSEYEALEAEVAASKSRADKYEGLYQTAVGEQTLALQEVAAYLPTAATELRQQLDIRLEEVTRDLDEQIRADVQDTLNKLTTAMEEGYRQVRDQNVGLQGQLAESRGLLESLMARTGVIERTVGTERVVFLGKRDVVLQRIETLTAEVNDWKYKHVDCKECPEKLRLSKRERDAISQIQLHTVGALQELRDEFLLKASELESGLQDASGDDAAEGAAAME